MIAKQFNRPTRRAAKTLRQPEAERAPGYFPSMRLVSFAVFALGLLAACSQSVAPKAPVDVRLERRQLATPILVASPEDPVGVTARGVLVARVSLAGPDSGYRLFDSTGAAIGPSAVPAIGVWAAGDDGNLYTLVPGALGIASTKPDGAAGPSYRLMEAGVLREIYADSVDLTRPTVDGFAIVRTALDRSGERVLLDTKDSTVQVLFGINAGPASADAALPSTTSSKGVVAVGNGQKYRILLFGADGKPKGGLGRTLPKLKLTPRQVEVEIGQITASQKLDDRYLAILRRQLANSDQAFFSPAQGMRFDGKGLLWVVGYEADSAFADVFGDTTFVKRFPLSCPGFDGQWDLKGDWLAVGCSRADTTGGAAEVQLYKVSGR